MKLNSSTSADASMGGVLKAPSTATNERYGRV
jgi:hypothetical protein